MLPLAIRPVLLVFVFMKRLFFALLFFSFLGSLHAQDALTGRVYEDKTNFAVPGITIRNLKTNGATVADLTGGFTIPAKAGDLVVFSGLSYVSDTLFVKDLKYIEIRLIPKSRLLNEVKVTGSEIKLGNLKDNRRLGPLGGQTVVYQTDADGNNKGGLALNIFDSHAAENKRKLNAKLSADEQTIKEVDGIFTSANLQKYLPIKGQEMQNFIILYRPDIETYRSPDFILTLYLNTSYEKFLKIPADQRASKELTDIWHQDAPPPPAPAKQQ